LHTIEPTTDRVFEQRGNVIKRLDEVIAAMDNAYEESLIAASWIQAFSLRKLSFRRLFVQ
jgi:hypothetical protein